MGTKRLLGWLSPALNIVLVLSSVVLLDGGVLQELSLPNLRLLLALLMVMLLAPDPLTSLFLQGFSWENSVLWGQTESAHASFGILRMDAVICPG